jgi:hypothetical protein
MNTPTWLIEAVQYQNDRNCPQRLSYLLQELGCEVIVFDDSDLSFLSNLKGKEPVVYYGSINTLLDIRQQEKSLPQPFAWYDPLIFSCKNYYKQLKPFILPENPYFSTLGALDNSELVDYLYSQHGKDDVVFIRPNDNEKTFTGTLVRKTNLRTWSNDMTLRRYVPEATEIIVSAPQKIVYEWRFIIVNEKVASGSQYMSNGFCDPMEGFDDRAACFAEEAASCWSPYPVYIMDVGEVPGRGFVIVEIGPFNYAGLYQSDIRAIAKAINGSLRYSIR